MIDVDFLNACWNCITLIAIFIFVDFFFISTSYWEWSNKNEKSETVIEKIYWTLVSLTENGTKNTEKIYVFLTQFCLFKWLPINVNLVFVKRCICVYVLYIRLRQIQKFLYLQDKKQAIMNVFVMLRKPRRYSTHTQL